MMLRSVILGLCMAAAAAVGYLMIPRQMMQAQLPHIEGLVPQKFGPWENVSSPMIQVDLSVSAPDGEKNIETPYDETVMRTYVNKKTGEAVMLALAYGHRQRQEIKIHRPELCYTSQGSAVSDLRPLEANERIGVVPEGAKTMLGRSSDRLESVLYWIRIGDVISRGALQTRGYIFKQGLRGTVPDGILVRSSQAIASPNQAQASLRIQQQFLNDMIAAVPADKRRLFVPMGIQL